MTDKLSIIFKLQEQLDNLIGFTKKEYQARVNENFISVLHEWTELHNETNWKPWKKTKKAENRDKKLDEYADIIHFIIQRALIEKFTPEEVFNAYVKKNIINRERVNNNY